MLPLHHSRSEDIVLQTREFGMLEKNWSGQQDSNLRPPGPKPGALARLRYAPNRRTLLASRGESITALAYLDKPLLGRYTSTRCESSGNGLLAQLAEQLTLNQRVVGSSPTRPTKTNSS